QRGRVVVHRQHPRPVGDERGADRAADPGRAAGDDRDATVEQRAGLQGHRRRVQSATGRRRCSWVIPTAAISTAPWKTCGVQLGVPASSRPTEPVPIISTATTVPQGLKRPWRNWEAATKAAEKAGIRYSGPTEGSAEPFRGASALPAKETTRPQKRT